MALTEVELGYAAGFMDGEGCIRAQRNAAGYASFSLRVSFGQNDARPLEWLKGQFGGSISLMNNGSTNQLFLTGEAACVFLETVLPYLIVKRRQAEYAIKAFRNGRITEEHSAELTRLKKVYD